MILFMQAAGHVFKALADPTRRAIFERTARWQRNESRTVPKHRNSKQSNSKQKG
jgi:hypothetical protein